MLLAVVVLLVGRVVWFWPRTNWSLRSDIQDDSYLKNLRKADPEAKDITHVILISIDTCRADHLGCYGYSRNTSPNIDALAAESIRFNHVVTPVPITLAAHSSILTGQTPLGHKVRDNNNYRLADSNVTLAEILRQSGFETGAVVGAFVLDSQFGLDQGFDTYDDEIEKQAQLKMTFHERSGREVTRLAANWLQRHRNNISFLFVHYFDPHIPYKAHQEFVFTSLPFLVSEKDRYDGEIAYADDCVGRLINELKHLGIYDSTLLIVTADHGEGLGEHHEKTHAHFIYRSTLHVPLIIRIPGGPEGIVINETVGLIDIVPTVCSILGIDVPPAVQGQDLSTLIFNDSGSFEERPVYCESLYLTKFGLGPLLGLTDGRWKYIHTANPELYDLEKDPYERKNLLDKHNEKTLLLKEQLRAILKNSDSADAADNKTVIDDETRNRLASLGYLAGQIVDDQIQFDQIGPDPKEYLEFSDFMGQFPTLINAGKIHQAKKLCNKMLKKWPNMSQLYYCLGEAAVVENDLDLIISSFTRYLSIVNSDSRRDYGVRVKPDYELGIAHGDLGVAYKTKGNLEKAKEHFTKAVAYNPYDVKFIQRLAFVFNQTGDTDSAVIYYKKALDISPDVPETHFYLANALFEQGKYEEAILHYNKALQLRPGWAEALGNLRAVQAQKSQQQRIHSDLSGEGSETNIAQ